MTTTNPIVTFGLYALALKQDMSPGCSNIQSFVQISDLRTGNITPQPIATMEPNFWLLDGGYRLLPENLLNVHTGLVSLSLSDSNGLFQDFVAGGYGGEGISRPYGSFTSTPPILTLTFGSEHSTDNLTLIFSPFTDDYASTVIIEYRDVDGVTICSDVYHPTSPEFATNKAVENFKSIQIVFTATNKPFRYLRLTSVDFGTLITFSGADIKSAKLMEQCDPLALELPINTFDLVLHSSDATFNLLDPEGDFIALQYRQPLAVYEEVDERRSFMGYYYLDEWKNQSETEIAFRCVDALGILETIPYYGNIYIFPITAQTLLSELLGGIGIPFELDATMIYETLTGLIPVGTYREALQQIALALGAYVTCSRTGIVTIMRMHLPQTITSPDYTITKAEKGADQSLTLRTLVTGVEVTAHSYRFSGEMVEIVNRAFTLGQHRIIFGEPMNMLNYTLTGATLMSSTALSALISPDSDGVTVVFTAERILETKSVVGWYRDDLDSDVRENIITIEDATLVAPSIVDNVATRLYNYYIECRYLQKVKLYAPEAAVTNSVLIDALYDKQILGLVEKMESDLAGGFTAQTQIVGVVDA